MSTDEITLAMQIMDKVLQTTGFFLGLLLPTIGVLGGVHLLIDFLFNITFRRIK